jgi:SAM-dependent methyltransferase
MRLDASRILKAFASNQLARFAPQAYVRLTQQTGRGTRSSESPENIADYFLECVADYFSILGIAKEHQATFVRDNIILEYGPGDLPGVALLLISMGARKVYCVDRFPLVNLSEKNTAVIQLLIEKIPDVQRVRLLKCFLDPHKLQNGFSPEKIVYLLKKNGLSELQNEIDLVISRAVLEHVNDLEATFLDMFKAMRPGALAVHQVDLKSHNLHRSNPLDFLEYSPWLWKLMYSHKGVPNRWRANYYQQLILKHPFEQITFKPTALFDEQVVAIVNGSLHKRFQGITAEELAWQGFWMVIRKRC